jgi:hypothetical protein
MTRAVLVAALCLGVPAFAAGADAQRELNQERRLAANRKLQADKKRVGNPDLTSLEVELCNQLGDDWTVRKSGNGYLVTRVAPKAAASRLEINGRMRAFRAHNQDAQVIRTGDDITLRGRIDDCADAARATENFAGAEGVNRIHVDISCSPNH